MTAIRLDRGLSDERRAFFDTYVLPALTRIEACLTAQPEDSAETISESICRARAELHRWTRQLD